VHHAYDYALVRIVPHAHTGDGEAVGVALHARRARVFAVILAGTPDALGARLAARWPGLDARLTACALRGLVEVAAGRGGPLGLLPPSERFHWLVATRSSALQAGPVRTGVSADPAAEAERIVSTLSAYRDLPPPRGV
jgi:hypothetical protein